MTVISVRKDPQALTLTIEAAFDAPPERVWQLWADPRQLERWWGPPGYPSTFTKHDLAPGGRAEYQMIGPQSDRHHGYWEFIRVEAPYRLVFHDGLANADGTPNSDTPPATTHVTIEAVDLGRSRMSIETVFPSAEGMEWLLATGSDVGRTRAVGQIDAILAAAAVTERASRGYEQGVYVRPLGEALSNARDGEPGVPL